jgi:hypothetical protein
MTSYWRAGRIALCAALVGAAIALAAGGIGLAGKIGDWAFRTEGAGVAERLPEFRPVTGDVLHIKSDASSTAKAESEALAVAVPYQVSWWMYATGEPYDDMVVYQAMDEEGKDTDISVIFRESEEKLPATPDEWQGMVWLQDAAGWHSVAQLRRPGWQRFRLNRKSEKEVELLINGEVIGSYPALSARPVRRISVGDFSVSEGTGEGYWNQMQVSPGAGAAGKEAVVSKWGLAATGSGAAEQGLGFEEIRRAHLFVKCGGEAPAEAKWGTFMIEVPYHFWCRVYVSEEPYRDFCVVGPLNRGGNPTDIELSFDDQEAPAGAGPDQQGFIWVADAEGKHQVGSVTRGVWHEFAMSRQTKTQVALLIDGRPAGTFVSRGADPVAAYRFGDFSRRSSRGEAYWYRIRLVQVPKQ